jgi:hypothetical protein
LVVEPSLALTLQTLVRMLKVLFPVMENVIDDAALPLVTLADPKVPLVRVYVHVTDWLAVMLALAFGPPVPLTAVGEPLVPPAGVYVAPADLPRRSFIEIAPDATPARVRTAVSPNEIEAVLDRPSSVFT